MYPLFPDERPFRVTSSTEHPFPEEQHLDKVSSSRLNSVVIRDVRVRFGDHMILNEILSSTFNLLLCRCIRINTGVTKHCERGGIVEHVDWESSYRASKLPRAMSGHFFRKVERYRFFVTPRYITVDVLDD